MRPLSPQFRYSLILFGFFLACLLYVHQNRFNGPTSVSRLDLLHALVKDGTVKIDGYQRNTTDKAIWNGHYYSDKAPGTVVIAAPAFAGAILVLRSLGIEPDSRMGWLVSSWIACAGSLALVGSLGAVACYWWLCRHVTSRIALYTVMAVFLGGMPLPYATMMFSHTLVVGLLAVSIWSLDRPATALTVKAARNYGWLGGLCAGTALASEYTSGIVIAGIFFWQCGVSKIGTRYFVLGCLPPLLLIPLYSVACFGTPFMLPYSAQASFPAMQQGLYAIKWPDALTAARLLFLPTRGLFFWSPFLLLFFGGIWQLRRKSTALFLLTGLVPVLHVLVISGRVWDWQAGPTLGPRYLSPLLPLLALPCALAFARHPLTSAYLAFYSIFVTLLATVTNATPEGSIYNPLLAVNFPAFFSSHFSHNLGLALGLPAWLSIMVFAMIIILGALLLPKYAPPISGPEGDEPGSTARVPKSNFGSPPP